MWCDAFPSEALYEADKALDKFAWSLLQRRAGVVLEENILRGAMQKSWRLF